MSRTVTFHRRATPNGDPRDAPWPVYAVDVPGDCSPSEAIERAREKLSPEQREHSKQLRARLE